MKMKKILSMGGRLQNLLLEAEAEVEKIISEANAKAEGIINKAKDDANLRLSQAERRRGIEDLLMIEEKKAKEEAKLIKREYEERINKLRKVPDDKREEAVSLIIEEVIPP
jgi:vacuolar-type H+-ATPase subunit H